MLDRRQKRGFVEDGYVVVPGVVPAGLVDDARREVELFMGREAPPAGPHFYSYHPGEATPGALRALFSGSPARAAAESLIAPGRFEPPEHVQIALNLPPFDHIPGGPHVDGLAPPEPDGRPGTFTLLAGVFLTDQKEENSGNLWVWPGTHLSAALYLRERGADALIQSSPYPPVPLPKPRQVTGRAGDLLLAHYLLGHNIGGNTSGAVRQAVYFRLRRENHVERWRDCVRDPVLEFDGVKGQRQWSN